MSQRQFSANSNGITRVHIGDIARLVNGNAYKPSDWDTSGTPIIRIQNLNDPSKPFNHWSGTLDDRVVVNPGDVLLAWSGTPGTSFGAHRWRDSVGVLNQHIFRMDLDLQRVDPDWFVFAVNQRLDALIRLAHGGVGLRHVTKGVVERLELSLPPLAEQRRIAGELTAAMEAVERARRAAQARLAAAQALPAAYLREVFEGPEACEWESRRLGDLCQAVEGQVDPREEEYGDLPHINGENIESGTGRLLTINTAAEDGLISGKYLFEAGMILYSKLRPYLRKVAIAPSKGVCSADMYPLIFAADQVDSHFAMYSLLAEPFTSYAVQESRRARMPKLNRKQLFVWRMRLPPLPEQRRIAAGLGGRLQATEAVIERCSEELAAIDALPAAYLRQAFEGLN